MNHMLKLRCYYCLKDKITHDKVIDYLVKLLYNKFKEVVKNYLNGKTTYTINEIKEKELDLSKPSSRYMTLLKQGTEKARKATSNQYFKFDEKDGFRTFNKKEYLLDQPKYKLYKIYKEAGLTKYLKL